jgi:predicted ATP-dependent endonuclease of OLD family
MLIKFIEIQNFRRLSAIRIDFSDKTTLFVGANNSGKTSAMLALGHFLIDRSRFATNDFTLSNWAAIEKIGVKWEEKAFKENGIVPDLAPWAAVLPSLDIWLEVGPGEIHYVRGLLPTLDWVRGLLGVRLRYQPKDVEQLCKEYLAAREAARTAKLGGKAKDGKTNEYDIKLWPENLRDFLDRKLRQSFGLRGYLLDPAKLVEPTNGLATPQPLSVEIESIEGNPLEGLIRIDEIAAQRGVGDGAERSGSDGDSGGPRRERQWLSEQMRSYFARHLDPSEFPEPEDLEALQAIETSQKAFDQRLTWSFANALEELKELNYPGVTDPKLKFATRLRPTDGLNHRAAVQYEVCAADGKVVTTALTLPEEYNGLGYQNLISIVFKLMSFRDAWMCVGKAGKSTGDGRSQPLLPRLHLVLIEEPEAHLHPQVQQVFVRKAYDILRKHGDLGTNTNLRTQLIVSTHSSHVTHEAEISWLRYFRRLPAGGAGLVPISAVINLSDVFGTNDETIRFVTRYLRATHCELFFADAAILIEGAAERMLIPHFIRSSFPKLNRSYITLLESGGSHAHRFRPLIERLGLSTLVITDLDSVEGAGHHKSAPPKRGANQQTGNATLKTWHPLKTSLDELLDLSEEDKERPGEVPMFAVRVAYQTPVTIKLSEGGESVEVLASTFEDALAYENVTRFKQIEGGKLADAFKSALNTHSDAEALSKALFDALAKGGKAELALDVLALKEEPESLRIPEYIWNGLSWLDQHLGRNQQEVNVPAAPKEEVAPP